MGARLMGRGLKGGKGQGVDPAPPPAVDLSEVREVVWG
jgi:hypothetical protein